MTRQGWFRLVLLRLVLACVLGALGWAHAAEPIKIGVLAFRPKPQAQAQWQPLATALKAAIPDQNFVVQAYTLIELELAVASHAVDFVLTNPGNYVLLTRRVGLQAPLATLLMDESGQETSAFGGVIFTRTGDSRITSLANVKGKNIATVSKDSMGGYQTQAFDLLQLGVDITRDASVVVTGMPQDNVVNAVLSGQADVGFVRTGLIEAMVREGKLDPAQVTVLNAQSLGTFPVKSSTSLYPEWPFSYLSHVDEHLARRVTAALFMLRDDSDTTRAMGIRGFSVPADYSPVVDMLRALRMPPFDVAPLFTWRDVVNQYRLQLVLAGIAAALILLLSLRLWLAQRQLNQEKKQVLRHQQALAESEFRWRFAVEVAGGCLWDWDVRAGTLYLSESWKAALGYGGVPFSDRTSEWESLVHPDDVAGALAALALCTNGQSDRYRSEHRMRCLDGSYKWMLELGQVVNRDEQGRALRVIGIDTDIHERKFAEQQLQLAANVFRFAREGITITDASGNILDVNEAYTQITGYSREEALGQNPRIMKSGRHDEAFYIAMFAELKHNGHWAGEIWNRRKSGEVYAEMLTISAVRDTAGKLTHYVALFFDITPIKEHQQQLEHIAHYDALTDLPNRVLLADRLRQAMVQAQRRGQLLAVAYLDLDGFKEINDTYGHDAGDRLLIAVSDSMKSTLREGDTLARLGGDEFVAVLADLKDVDDCAGTLTRLLEAAAQPMALGDDSLQVSASLGVTFYPQSRTVDAEQLMRQADLAMYQAKVAGKNRYHAFDAVYEHSLIGLHESLDEIARAIDEAELLLLYQPKVNLRTGRVLGVEALLRWQHPTRGLLMPAQFLPVIEGHILAVGLGEWVIRSALAQVQRWLDMGLQLQVSVNVGARQMQQIDFVQRVGSLLAEFPLVSPELLQIEVLETSALKDLARTAEVINACGRMGVSFALDDFGTGYSSLTYLKHLPVKLIKIDQSFVQDMLDDPNDLAILEGVIGLARSFHREVMIEGLETVVQGNRVLALGCELAQGFGIAQPMPGADVPAWVAQWRTHPSWASGATGQLFTSLP